LPNYQVLFLQRDVNGGLKTRKSGGDKWRSFEDNMNQREAYF